MSYEALGWAAKVLEQYPPNHEQMTTNVRFVLLILANRADEDGYLYPSVRWIMKRTALSESAVRKATRTIQSLGLLQKKESRRDDGGQGSNEYYLAMSQYVLRLDPPGIPETRGVVSGAAPVHIAEGPGPHRTPQETKEDTKGSKPLCPLSADLFEQAFALLPKRAGNNPKAAAVKAWNARMREKVDPQVILAGARRYREFCMATGKVGTETVMMASTFFGTNRCFEQDFTAPKPPEQRKAAVEWYATASGIEAKAKELGMEPWCKNHNIEPFVVFAARVRKLADSPVSA